MTTWTQERVDELARCIAENMSFSEAAAILRTGRDACIGKAFRLRNAGDARFEIRIPERAHRVPRQRDHAVEPKPRAYRRAALPAPEPKVSRLKLACKAMAALSPIPDIEATMPLFGKPLWELADRECHYVVSRGTYCGEPAHRAGGYCTHHNPMVYAKRRAA